MRRVLLSTLLVVAIVLIALVVYLCQSPSRIVIANTGSNVVEVKTDGSEKKILLDPNGTGYFDSDSEIQIGDALIRIGRRIEVANIGSGVIEVTYNDIEASERTTMLGEGGSGYFSKSTPIAIGDLTIRVGNER